MKKTHFFLFILIFSSLSVFAFEGGSYEAREHVEAIEKAQERHPDHFDDSINAQKSEAFRKEQELREFGMGAGNKL